MSFSHPLWKAAFRPMFALGMLAGAVLPLLWVVQLTSNAVPPAPTSGVSLVSPMVWHAHEMFFGFGGAILGGFLLTASKNWVAIRGYHGAALAALAGAWLVDRLALAISQHWSPFVFWLASSLFVCGFVVMVSATLIRHRAHDSYGKDNRYFLIALPLLLPAKWLLLQPEHFAAGTAMALAIFRLAFLLMLERTLTQFMNATFKVTLPRPPWRDHGIKSLALLLVFVPLLSGSFSLLIAGSHALCGGLLLWRVFSWYPLHAMKRIELAVMYLGQFAIVAQLLVGATVLSGSSDEWVGSLARIQTHLFTVGALGLIVPAMIMRISKGHTGRKVHFDTLDKAVLWLMLIGLITRIGVPVALPGHYSAGLWLSATCWLLGFGTLAVRYIPFLLANRVDGREH